MSICKRFPTGWLCVPECEEPAHDEFLTADHPTREERYAAVLAEHWEVDVDNGGDQTEFYCDGCKETLVVGDGAGLDHSHRAHVAAALVAADPAPEAVDAPDVLYHWSPSRNRDSIQRHGLRPGSPSNTFPEWSAAHLCYGTTPSAALSLTLLDDELDLWMVRTGGHDFTLANEGAEWRCAEHVSAWYVGTREPRDAVTEMTPAEQAEADEVVAHLHEQRIANGEVDD